MAENLTAQTASSLAVANWQRGGGKNRQGESIPPPEPLVEPAVREAVAAREAARKASLRARLEEQRRRRLERGTDGS